MTTKIRSDNCYRVTIEEVVSLEEMGKTRQFELQDREDLFKAVET
ncbi:DUF3861 domain-containing protein [Shewanella sp. GutCb]|nr:DUF3861 domain-containing protein [Shewanella sp. GutCb]